LPSTAADPNVGIPDIEVLENNIHAGAKYLAFLRDRYFSADEIEEHEREFFALAAYNAGPERVHSCKGVPPFPETETFVKRVMDYYRTYSEKTK